MDLIEQSKLHGQLQERNKDRQTENKDLDMIYLTGIKLVLLRLGLPLMCFLLFLDSIVLRTVSQQPPETDYMLTARTPFLQGFREVWELILDWRCAYTTHRGSDLRQIPRQGECIIAVSLYLSDSKGDPAQQSYLVLYLVF